MRRTPAVGVLGLGEAGSRIALDLARAGCAVRGYDPAPRSAPEEVERAVSPVDAARDAALVLSVNAAAVALEVARDVAPALRAGQVYADLNTAAPELKRELAQAVEPSGALFADVALLGPVPRDGVGTSALASGPGAARFAELMGPLGMPVELVGAEPGEAAGRKLVRSVFMKGLAAAVVESLEAGAAAGIEEWVRAEIVRALEIPSAELVERLVAGTHRHAVRRREEMAAAAEYLLELGVEPRVARAAEALLAEVAERAAVHERRRDERRPT